MMCEVILTFGVSFCRLVVVFNTLDVMQEAFHKRWEFNDHRQDLMGVLVNFQDGEKPTRSFITVEAASLLTSTLTAYLTRTQP